jgi:putative ABC transport system substrate-binding protein
VEKPYRVGFLVAYPYDPGRAFVRVFLPAMRDLGYIEGRNLQIEVRSANNRSERLPTLAAEMVRLKVDVIVTGGDSEVRAAKQATSTIPL